VVYLKKANPNLTAGEKLVEMMRGKATVKMTTSEIMSITRGEE
jgi:hypothetical protein